ncbi:MAG: glycosyltransferase [Balneolales bacterium]
MHSVVALIKQIITKIFYLYHKNTAFDEVAFVNLKPNGESKGNVLVSYIAESFFLKENEPIPNRHTQYWESLEIANIFLRRGYSVDVISYRNLTFVPGKKYKIFIGSRTNFERLANSLNPDCIKVAHMDMSHWLFNNSAAISRCHDLKERKNITLRSYRLQEENWAVEYADHITILGNKFTEETYEYSKKPIHRLPIPSCTIYPKPETKDFEKCRKNFLWFGSRGMVHKGLDLVIDAFLELPDHHLTICGPIEEDKDLKFSTKFYKELYDTPNIHTIGWADVDSPEFKNITDSCISIIYPSSAEGGGGCVITAMHAGLIPIVSYEASVDVDDSFGIVLRENTIDEIKKIVVKISGERNDVLRNMANEAWKIARLKYTRKNYSKAFENLVEKLENESKVLV